MQDVTLRKNFITFPLRQLCKKKILLYLCSSSFSKILLLFAICFPYLKSANKHIVEKIFKKLRFDSHHHLLSASARYCAYRQNFAFPGNPLSVSHVVCDTVSYICIDVSDTYAVIYYFCLSHVELQLVEATFEISK